MHPFIAQLRQRITYFDGGFGTILQAMGLKGGEQPESWNLTHPEAVKRASTWITCARVRIWLPPTPLALTRCIFPIRGKTVLRAGVRLAKEAVAEFGSGAVALDAGSVGRLLRPLGELAFEDAVGIYRAMALAGIDAGCDLLLAETMTDLREIKAAVLGYGEAMAQTGSTLPVLVSMSFDVNGRLLTGSDIEGAAALLTSMQGVDALGLNCGREPAALLPNLRRLVACAGDKPVFFMPNASVPTLVDGQTVFATQPEIFAKDMAEAARIGAHGLGGCCGTTPAHIAALIAATCDQRPVVFPSHDMDGLSPTAISAPQQHGNVGRAAFGDRRASEPHRKKAV